jgi:hypothetical protein
MVRSAIGPHVLVALLVLPAGLAAPGGAACQANTTYSGDAFGASLNVLGIKANLLDTGPLPATGGTLSTQLLNADVPGILSLGLLSESTTGGSNRASSQSSVANANLRVAGIGISASLLTSNATATACGGGIPSVAGGSNIANLMVNGQTITVTGEPNQRVPLIVGSLIINEQISSLSSSSCGGSANMLVNALHLKVAGIADVVISSSQAGVSCVPPPA